MFLWSCNIQIIKTRATYFILLLPPEAYGVKWGIVDLGCMGTMGYVCSCEQTEKYSPHVNYDSLQFCVEQLEMLRSFTMESILAGIHYFRCHDYVQLLALSHILPEFLHEHPKVCVYWVNFKFKCFLQIYIFKFWNIINIFWIIMLVIFKSISILNKKVIIITLSYNSIDNNYIPDHLRKNWDIMVLIPASAPHARFAQAITLDTNSWIKIILPTQNTFNFGVNWNQFCWWLPFC